VSAQSIVITGIGVVSSIGAGVERFGDALYQGACGVRNFAGPPPFAAALLDDFDASAFVDGLSACPTATRQRAKRLWRHSTYSARVTGAAAMEAWFSAGCTEAEGANRTGIVTGGNNTSQQYLAEAFQLFSDTPEYLSPRHAFLAMDTHPMSQISEILEIHGFGLTTGAASASGNAALWNARQLLLSGAADRILVCGVCQELSPLERQAYTIMGAMAVSDPAADPGAVYRPFDCASRGFVAGEGSACVVLETGESAAARGASVWAVVPGASLLLDGSHLPHTSVEGERRAMSKALLEAGLQPQQIDLVSAHGSGSEQGDRVECEALSEVFGDSKPWVNSTKSLTGHCLTAAGLVEIAACVLQMRRGFVHANRNLDRPIDPRIRFAGPEAIDAPVRNILSNSFGFGGINSSVILSHSERLDSP
jgi:malonyl-ACP decarboxylase